MLFPTDIVSSTDTEVQLITFISLKKKIIDLIIGALRISSDSTNTQMLLGIGIFSLIKYLSNVLSQIEMIHYYNLYIAQLTNYL